MTRKGIEQEFKKIDYELFVNRPNFTPYPPNVVKRREFLLFAQVHLGNILGAKIKKDKVEESLQEFSYWVIMEEYYNWDKSSKQRTLRRR